MGESRPTVFCGCRRGGNTKCDGVTTSVNKMRGEAVIESDWPLCTRSKNRGECTESMTEDTQIDCPEYVLFRLNHGESWDMKKVENIKEAQQFISKQGLRNKQKKTIVVLHKLEYYSRKQRRGLCWYRRQRHTIIRKFM